MKAIVCAVAVLCMGCASMKYGDGKVGPVPLDPAVDALAKAIDKNAPGSGNYVREWFAVSGIERVPAGYVVVWDSYLNGAKINEADIVRTPRLAVRDGGNAPPVVVVT